jgi:hypothetical protein
MVARCRNPRLAKWLRCYNVAEAAELYGVHRNTIRHWQASGLVPIDNSRPALFHGTVLNAFHLKARKAARKSCGPGEMYCLACRGPRRPALNMVDYVPSTDTVGTLTGICPDCGNVMQQKVGDRRLEKFRHHATETARPGHVSLEKSSEPHLDCDLESEVNGHETEPHK